MSKFTAIIICFILFFSNSFASIGYVEVNKNNIEKSPFVKIRVIKEQQDYVLYIVVKPVEKDDRIAFEIAKNNEIYFYGVSENVMELRFVVKNDDIKNMEFSAINTPRGSFSMLPSYFDKKHEATTLDCEKMYYIENIMEFIE